MEKRVPMDSLFVYLHIREGVNLDDLYWINGLGRS